MTPAIAPATATGFEVAETLSISMTSRSGYPVEVPGRGGSSLSSLVRSAAACPQVSKSLPTTFLPSWTAQRVSPPTLMSLSEYSTLVTS
jgi:hypothetical protein